MKALIVEDIPKTSDLIKNRITHVTKEIQSCDQAYSLTEARDLISKNNYDIVSVSYTHLTLPTSDLV